MPITLRSSLSVPLTNEQLDENFTFLETGINNRLLSSEFNATNILAELNCANISRETSGIDSNIVVKSLSIDGNQYFPDSNTSPSTIVVRDGSSNITANNVYGNIFYGNIKLKNSTTDLAQLNFNQTNSVKPINPLVGDVWLINSGLFLNHNDSNGLSSIKKILTLSVNSPYSEDDKIEIHPNTIDYSYLRFKKSSFKQNNGEIGDFSFNNHGLFVKDDTHFQKIITTNYNNYSLTTRDDKVILESANSDGASFNIKPSLSALPNASSSVWDAGDLWSTLDGLFFRQKTTNSSVQKQIAYTSSDITGTSRNITGILSIDHGGTSATNIELARTNLECAKRGINDDIKQLTHDFDVPLNTQQGGTGISSNVNINDKLLIGTTDPEYQGKFKWTTINKVDLIQPQQPIDLTTDVINVLPIINGGTGLDTARVDKNNTNAEDVDNLLMSVKGFGTNIKWAVKSLASLITKITTSMSEDDKFELYPIGTVLPVTWLPNEDGVYDNWMASHPNWKFCNGLNGTLDLRGRVIACTTGDLNIPLNDPIFGSIKTNFQKYGQDNGTLIGHTHEINDAGHTHRYFIGGHTESHVPKYRDIPNGQWQNIPQYNINVGELTYTSIPNKFISGSASTDVDNKYITLLNALTGSNIEQPDTSPIITIEESGLHNGDRNSNIQPTIYLRYIQKIK